MQWISEYSSALNFFVNLGMLLAWVAYLHLFLVTYMRARRPRIIINRVSGSDLNGLCLLSNMSQEPVYAQNVYCTIHRASGDLSATITDREILQRSAEGDRPDGVTANGPLNRGEFMTLGSFRNLLDITAEQAEDYDGSGIPDDVERFQIMVVGAFGGDDLEVAAQREFRVDRSSDPWQVVPVSPQTRQISSRSERKRIRQMIKSELEQV
ncbi:hypothetical protein [Pelagovum pacificum]|uniref:Uncharacterized protein n=1 Tax=Pelagovum pacificum TaxID=2588711 RepID=A0A5C5GFL1_9RHOB|nr:hypothetical protein [Pelagovum pacificum]QQA43874.1 hypothetical protein I8N54_04655 [Pelagovum pacificum]TNY32994.1 hypothetical protein FHY64_06880 [Pelagovum pacificum]